ncbi:hypothetical protein, partial [Treponema sp. R6D11]
LEIGDPTEIALVQMGEDVNASQEKLEKDFKRIDELPFDSDRKMMSKLYEKNGKTIIVPKAPLTEMLADPTHILIDRKILIGQDPVRRTFGTVRPRDSHSDADVRRFQ